MTDLEHQQIKERIAQWAAAAPVLQAVRDEDVSLSHTAEGIFQLASVANMTLPNMPPGIQSGLVEQQAWFAIIRERAKTLKIRL